MYSELEQKVEGQRTIEIPTTTKRKRGRPRKRLTEVKKPIRSVQTLLRSPIDELEQTEILDFTRTLKKKKRNQMKNYEIYSYLRRLGRHL